MIRDLVALALVAWSAAFCQTPCRIHTVAGSLDPSEGDGGPATRARLYAPVGLAVDSSGNLVVSDADNRRIRRITPDRIITTIAGTGIAGFDSQARNAATAQLRAPQGVAFDGAGNLYIADAGNFRIRTVTPDGTIPSSVQFISTAPQSQGGGLRVYQPYGIAVDLSRNVYVSVPTWGLILRVASNGTWTTIVQRLGQPTGLVFDRAGNLYIVETANNRIVKRTPEGNIVPLPGVSPARARIAPRWKEPQGIALDARGNLYVADTGNHRVRKLSVDGSIITVAGRGAPGFGGDGGPAAEALLRSPRAVAIDAAGNLYIADTGNGRVRKVSPAGVITTIAGIGKAYLGSDTGPADAALLHEPRGLAVDDASNVYIADTGSNRIVELTPDRRIIRTVAGTGEAGFGGDGGPAEAAHLNRPQGVAVDRAGNLYIADTGNHRIRKVSAGGTITTVAGSGVEGFGGDGGPAVAAYLRSPLAVTADAIGNLYVADTGNNRVRRVGVDGRIRTVAGGGRSYWSGEPVPASTVGLFGPHGLQSDRNSELYMLTGLIAKLSPEGLLSTVAGGPWECSPGRDGDGRQATLAAIRAAQAVAVDNTGNLFIAEAGTHRIRKVMPNGIIWTLAGARDCTASGGQPEEDAPAALARMQSPGGVAINAAGDLYIADTGNHRIRKVPGASTCGREGPPAIGFVDAGIIGGKLVTIVGVKLGPEEGVSAVPDSSGMIGATLAGTRALFDDEPATILYTQYNQVNAVIPGSVVRTAPYGAQQPATVTVEYLGERSPSVRVFVVYTSPFLLTAGSSGWGQAVAWNEDGEPNSASNPAAKGSVVTLFATGEGATDPPREDGRPATEPLPRPVFPVIVFIGCTQPFLCNISYATELVEAVAAPGLLGVLRVKFRVPAVAPSGPAVPVVLRILETPSQANVTIAVR